KRDLAGLVELQLVIEMLSLPVVQQDEESIAKETLLGGFDHLVAGKRLPATAGEKHARAQRLFRAIKLEFTARYFRPRPDADIGLAVTMGLELEIDAHADQLAYCDDRLVQTH